jgi:hypothetical protein
LEQLGLSEITYQGVPAVRIPYLSAAGVEASVRFRLALTKSEDGDERFRWKQGAKPMLYGLWRLQAARARGAVLLVEGESDCHSLWFHGYPAVGLPGAALWREKRDAEHFEDIPVVYVVIEPDAGGDAVRASLSRSVIRDRVRLVSLDELGGVGPMKDVSDLHVLDPGLFAERLHSLLEKAIPWREVEQVEADRAQEEAWAECAELAQLPRILDAFECDLTAIGAVGVAKVAKLLYLVLTTRLLEWVVSAAIKAPSAAGKSFLLDKVMAFFPEDAAYMLTAMSERALAYSDEPLAHRFLVLYEAAGLKNELADYMIRSLLSEGRLRYETVEKTSEGMRPRLIEREGPTGLLVTTTAVSLDPELETRLLSIPIPDSKEQTKAILLALAQTAPPPNLARWHALQRWLAGCCHKVTIPYATALAELIPPLSVRLRRDFGLLLNLIRAHAVLHQATRERDQEGCIIATIDDYIVVRVLVSDLISEGVEATVPANVREVVDAVAELSQDSHEGVSLAKIATRLQLDKSAVSRRVRKAEKAGYLKNLEERRGKPARIRTADPLHDDIQLLPETSAIEVRCTVDAKTEGVKTPLPQKAPEENERLILDDVAELIADGFLVEVSDAFRWAPRPGKAVHQSDVLTIELSRLVPNEAFCRHENHRDSDWKTPDGRIVCGICHPPARPDALAGPSGQEEQRSRQPSEGLEP